MTQRLIQKVDGNVYSGLISPVPGSPDICISHAVFRMTGSGGGGREANLMRQRTIISVITAFDTLTPQMFYCFSFTIYPSLYLIFVQIFFIFVGYDNPPSKIDYMVKLDITRVF